MNKIMAANFRGTEILGVELEGTVFVVLKPLVEAMGLAWNGQLERIKRDVVLSEGMRVIRIPSLRGGDQDTVTLRLDRLHGWLFTVDSRRVREEIRERIHVFQRECYEALYRHFCKDQERLAKEANDSESLGLRMVTEARQTYGERAAAQLWEKLGLPMVPAMAEVFRQYELFNDQSAQGAA
jgi:hypothetical protein